MSPLATQAAAAGLEELDISHTGVAHLPPFFNSATSLRCLKMTGPASLELNSSDVAVLLQLTALQQLWVGHNTTIPAAMERLQWAAPQLEIHASETYYNSPENVAVACMGVYYERSAVHRTEGHIDQPPCWRLRPLDVLTWPALNYFFTWGDGRPHYTASLRTSLRRKAYITSLQVAPALGSVFQFAVSACRPGDTSSPLNSVPMIVPERGPWRRT